MLVIFLFVLITAAIVMVFVAANSINVNVILSTKVFVLTSSVFLNCDDA